jgi:hypothetical protein
LRLFIERGRRRRERRRGGRRVVYGRVVRRKVYKASRISNRQISNPILPEGNKVGGELTAIFLLPQARSTTLK